MNNRVYKQFHPYFLAGLAVVIGLVLLTVFVHLLFAALIVGGLIYIASRIMRVFSSKSAEKPQRKPVTYEHGDYK